MKRHALVQLTILAASMALAACGSESPTAPSNTVDFQGVWQGNWQRTACSETGAAQGFACSNTPSSGGLRITLTQSGTEVQGAVEVASFFVPASGNVSGSGTLSLAGQARLQTETGTLSNWSTTRSGNTMNGSFTLTIVPDPPVGTEILQLTLQNVTKIS